MKSMISGICPYKGCEGTVWLGLPDGVQLPVFHKHECEECKKIIWTKLSRIDPTSYTEEGFLEHFTVNEETKEIKEKV